VSESEDHELKQVWDVGLTEIEIFLVGEIVAHWGALEHEVFCQTLMTFDVPASEEDFQLPKAMSNFRFADVLELWNERVVGAAKEPDKSILNDQYNKIKQFYDYRNALVHGMWDWDLSKPEVLNTTRILKKNIIKTTFNPGDLEHFHTELAQINLLVRYPGGMYEFFEKELKDGAYVNHAALRRLKLKDDL